MNSEPKKTGAPLVLGILSVIFSVVFAIIGLILGIIGISLARMVIQSSTIKSLIS